MRLIHGVDMFKEPRTCPTTFCVTTNGVVRPAGNGGYELVMGAGAAKAAKDFCPMLPYLAANAIKKLHPKFESGWMGYADEHGGEIFRYYLQNVGRPGDLSISFLLVQTKDHWKYKSEPGPVSESMARLKEWTEIVQTADALTGQKREFRLNYPAIGRGGLSMDVVRPWVEALPDNVKVYLL